MYIHYHHSTPLHLLRRILAYLLNIPVQGGHHPGFHRLCQRHLDRTSCKQLTLSVHLIHHLVGAGILPQQLLVCRLQSAYPLPFQGISHQMLGKTAFPVPHRNREYKHILTGYLLRIHRTHKGLPRPKLFRQVIPLRHMPLQSGSSLIRGDHCRQVFRIPVGQQLQIPVVNIPIGTAHPEGIRTLPSGGCLHLWIPLHQCQTDIQPCIQQQQYHAHPKHPAADLFQIHTITSV